VELENYVKQNPGIDITTLADNRVFIREIEDKVEAPEYFESPADFRKVCEALLSKMAINDAPIKDKV